MPSLADSWQTIAARRRLSDTVETRRAYMLGALQVAEMLLADTRSLPTVTIETLEQLTLECARFARERC